MRGKKALLVKWCKVATSWLRSMKGVVIEGAWNGAPQEKAPPYPDTLLAPLTGLGDCLLLGHFHFRKMAFS